MKEEIVAFIEELKKNPNIMSFNEEETKQSIILKLLSILQWDIFNNKEVKPEYSVGNKSVDYSLICANTNKVFLEVKRTREDLEKHQEQLLGYAFGKGVKIAILTNGITWWFYLSLREGRWEQRKFYTIDILQQNSEDIATKFIDFLSRDKIFNGKAVQNAEAIYTGQQKANILTEILPRAWNKIIEESNTSLIDLLNDITEELCGYRPEVEDVTQFLSAYMDRFLISTERPPIEPARPSISRPREQQIQRGQRTLNQEFRIPILKALVALGGSGESRRVIEKVESEMRDILTPVDYKMLPSGVMPRWENTAHWERYVMVRRDGLLRSDSPRGLWEITEEGRKYLANYNG